MVAALVLTFHGPLDLTQHVARQLDELTADPDGYYQGNVRLQAGPCGSRRATLEVEATDADVLVSCIETLEQYGVDATVVIEWPEGNLEKARPVAKRPAGLVAVTPVCAS